MRKKNTKILSFIASKVFKDKSARSFNTPNLFPPFSPDISINNKWKVYQTRVFKQDDLLNQFYHRKNLHLRNTNSLLDSDVTIKSINANEWSNKWTQAWSTYHCSNDDSNSTSKFRDIVAHKISKTPMEWIHNPLKTHAFGYANNSQSNENSDIRFDNKIVLFWI